MVIVFIIVIVSVVAGVVTDLRDWRKEKKNRGRQIKERSRR